MEHSHYSISLEPVDLSTVRTIRPPRRDSGFSLIEVLISIVVLSFGVLGMVGMQAAALQANREARLQSSAVVLGRELGEMMRANKDIANLTTSATNPYLGAFSTPLAATAPNYCLSVTASTACPNATDIASAQMTDWLTRVDRELPGATVVTCFDSAPFDAGGLPQWACTNPGAGGVMVVKIGWTRGSTDRSLTGAAAFEKVTTTTGRPSVIFSVTAGSAL